MQNQDNNFIGKTLYEMLQIFRTIELDEQETEAILAYTKRLYLPDLKQNS